jgi:hypothetical protein
MKCPLINKTKSNGLCRDCPFHRPVADKKVVAEECLIEMFDNKPWKQQALIMRHLNFNEGVW